MNKVIETKTGLVSTLTDQEAIINEMRHLTLRLKKQRQLTSHYKDKMNNDPFSLTGQEFDKMRADHDSAMLHGIEIRQQLNAQRLALRVLLDKQFFSHEKEKLVKLLVDLLVKEMER